MNWRGVVLMAVSWLAMEGLATAHPGHGPAGGSESLFHYLTEPFHAGIPLMIAAGLAGFAFAAWRSSRRKG